MSALQSKPKDLVGDGGLVTIAEAAEFLGVCNATVMNLVNRGELPCARIGRRARRIPRQALTEYANRALRR